MKSFIRQSMVKFFDKLGYEIQLKKKGQVERPHFFNHPPSLPAFFQLLKNLDFQPMHIMDVGAHKGTWTEEAMNYFPTAFYTLLEPQPKLADALITKFKNHNNVSIICAGAAATKGTMNFTFHRAEDCRTFLLDAEEAKKLGYQQFSLPVITLDDYIKENVVRPRPDILKIDAEGLDIEVLKGAILVLETTEMIFIEAAVNNLRFPNSVYAVVEWLDKQQYRLFDITSTNRPYWPYALWTTELVFVRKNGKFDLKDLNTMGGFSSSF